MHIMYKNLATVGRDKTIDNNIMDLDILTAKILPFKWRQDS